MSHDPEILRCSCVVRRRKFLKNPHSNGVLCIQVVDILYKFVTVTVRLEI